MQRQKRKEWYVLVLDDDVKTAGITDPVVDDSDWIYSVCKEQKKGRNIRSQTVEAENYNQIEPWLKSNGFKLVPINDIIAPPKDRSAEYLGPLPDYAKKASRARLVKILCRNLECKRGQTTWAEMNKDFPGLEILKKAKLGEYRANCLRCGYEATDNYNWGR